jgi:plasmid stabilization system protein ParE
MTKPRYDDSADLSDLVNHARNAVELDEARRVSRARHESPLKRLLPRVVGVVFVISLVLAADSIWHHVAPRSEQKAVDDLVKLIDQARDSVEAARSQFGRLPERLPNASLAGVVRYGVSSDGSQYVLIVEHDDVRVVRNIHGENKVMKRGNK